MRPRDLSLAHWTTRDRDGRRRRPDRRRPRADVGRFARARAQRRGRRGGRGDDERWISIDPFERENRVNERWRDDDAEDVLAKRGAVGENVAVDAEDDAEGGERASEGGIEKRRWGGGDDVARDAGRERDAEGDERANDEGVSARTRAVR